MQKGERDDEERQREEENEEETRGKSKFIWERVRERKRETNKVGNLDRSATIAVHGALGVPREKRKGGRHVRATHVPNLFRTQWCPGEEGKAKEK